MSWLPPACSTAWNWWERPCAVPWMLWRRPRRSGWRPACPPSGWSGMAAGLPTGGCPLARGSGRRWRTPSARTARRCWPCWQRRRPPRRWARCGKKRETVLVCNKAQSTETCDAELPHLITDVQTLPAPTPDREGLGPAQAALARRELLPATQLVDAAYPEGAALLQSAQQYQIDLVGPVVENTTWQARAGQGFGTEAFAVDWPQRQVTCPGGKQSARWRETAADDRPVIKVFFAVEDCRACPCRPQCTRSTTTGRSLTLPAQAVYEALAAARTRQQTAAFQSTYAARAGIEGTHTQAVRRCGVRQARYVGAAKTHLQDLLTAAAINFVRVGYWMRGAEPARTRQSRFTQLAAVPT